MHIRAVSVGYAVPRTDFDAVVHSVFQSAANLKPDGADRLLTLVAAGHGDLPQGICLDTPLGFSFRQLAAGNLMACRAGIIRAEEQDLSIDLRHAQRWESNLSSVRVNMCDAAVRAAWDCAWQVLNARQLEDRSDILALDLVTVRGEERSVWVRHIGRSMRALLDATVRRDPGAAEGIDGLIGLGPGLTPAGDDLLAGYLLGLRCTTNGDEARLRFLSAIAEAVIRLSRSTNDISRTYLFHATQGEASSLLVELAVAVCGGAQAKEVVAKTEAAMRVGHSSGMESVTGLLLGLAAWDGRIPLRA